MIHKIEENEEQSTKALCGVEGEQVSEYNSSVTCSDCALIINKKDIEVE